MALFSYYHVVISSYVFIDVVFFLSLSRGYIENNLFTCQGKGMTVLLGIVLQSRVIWKLLLAILVESFPITQLRISQARLFYLLYCPFNLFFSKYLLMYIFYLINFYFMKYYLNSLLGKDKKSWSSFFVDQLLCPSRVQSFV